MEKEWLQYGVLGLVVIGMAYYILYIERERSKERKEWREVLEKQQERVNDIADENNKIIREHTNILIGLKTLLENRRYER